MRATKSKHKSYADISHRNLEFEVGDNVLLEVMPMKGVLRFKHKDRLRSCFLETFEILD